MPLHKTMRIALVTTSFLPLIGGASFVIHHLAHQWTLQGHDVCVINSVTDKVTHPDATYSVYKFNDLRGSYRFGYHRFPFSWYAIREIKRLISAYKPDFISAHFGYPIALLLSKLYPLPKYSVTCHGGDLRESERLRKAFKIDALLADALNNADSVIAISAYIHKQLEALGVIPSKIFDIPNGVDTAIFQKQVRFNLRERFGIPQDAIVILSVGNDRPAKAFDIGIKAFAQLQSKIPTAYYIIIGHGTDKWLSLTHELGIAKNTITYKGLSGDELIGAYQQSDIFFSPSIREACPLVVLEAMAAGLPEVVTNVSGSQDIIQTAINGIVVEPGNIAQMSDGLLQLACDKSLRKTISAANIIKSESYDWNKISRMYLEHG